MTFRNDHIFATGTQNPCVMDSDIPDIEGSPTENLEDSWIPKEFTVATVTAEISNTNFGLGQLFPRSK